MTITRRNFLRSLSAGVGSMMLPRLGLASAMRSADRFSSPFVTPPLDYGNREENRVVFDLNLRQGHSEFIPGLSTPTLGINSDYLGPVLRARKGDQVQIRVRNGIGEASTLHWHGFTLPARMDGGPHQSIPDRGEWTAQFEILQDASTLWFHSHQFHRTGPQVYQGLAGLFIVDDEHGDSLALPSSYGSDDFPVILQDRDFNADGSFRYVDFMPEIMHGKHGNTVLVNGVVQPRLSVDSQLIRLRLLNGSNARIYRLAFHDNRPFQLIAGDGGYVPTPVQLAELTLSPGERAEIVVDVSDKSPLILKGLEGAFSSSGMMGMMMARMGFDREFDLLMIDPRKAQPAATHVPPQLPSSVSRLKPELAMSSRILRMDMNMMGMMGGRNGGRFTINDRSMDMQRIDFRVKRNSHEVWEIINASPMPHPFHVHNVQFRVIDRNGRQPAPHESGLKDTVLVNAREKVRILIPFGPYADPNKPYMFHCHNLEHEDQGMMGQFTVEA